MSIHSQELFLVPQAHPRPGECLRRVQLSCLVQAECMKLDNAVKGTGL